MAIAVVNPITGREIRRRADIFAEQSARIRALLDTAVHRREMYDNTLGFRYRAGYEGADDRLSPQGTRGGRIYQPTPPPGRVRVAAFGDSFVYANEVTPEESWAARLEQHFPALEVLNYGVGGYGVDQALLRYRLEGAALAPQVVVMGFMPDDLRRVVNVYRRFISSHEWPLVKPRFVLTSEGSLALRPPPIGSLEDYRRFLADPAAVRALGQEDYWYETLIYENPLYDASAVVRLGTHAWIRFRNRYVRSDRLVRGPVFNPASSAFRIQVLLFETFAAEATQGGAQPLVVLLPDREAVQRLRRGQRPSYAPLADALLARGIAHVDLGAAFAAALEHTPPDALFRTGGHYSPAGNEVVARALGPRLVELAAVIPGRL